MGDLLSETHYVDLQAPSHMYCLSKVNHQSIRAIVVAATFKLVAIEVKYCNLNLKLFGVSKLQYQNNQLIANLRNNYLFKI